MTNTETLRCGRPTKSRTPCRQSAADYRFGGPCKRHGSVEELAQIKALRAAYEDGFRNGGDWERRIRSSEIDRLKSQVEQLQEAALPPRRMATESGQIVEVGNHAYVWPGLEPLAVGDGVLLPESWVDRARGASGPRVGYVSALGTRYSGPLRAILRRSDDPGRVET